MLSHRQFVAAGVSALLAALLPETIRTDEDGRGKIASSAIDRRNVSKHSGCSGNAVRIRLRQVIPCLLVAFCWSFFFQLTAAHAAPEKMSIDVARDKATTVAMFGQMSVDGHFLCYTLEPPIGGGPEGKGPIPGTYSGHLRYDHADCWRIELDDVPGFTNVQIHVGNYPKNTKGCVLVGLDRDVDKGVVLKSKEAYAALKKAFYGTDTPDSTPNKEISVTISDKR
jgi:hypothetical protein